MNGAYSLFLDDLFEGASAFAAHYRSLENFDMAKRLFRHWTDRSKALEDENEYVLVDEFADMLGLRDWCEWRRDPGDHEVTDTVLKGATNPELLEELHPVAIWHLLSGLRRYDKLPVATVREIAFEVGLPGQTGLDYASTDKNYTLRTIPGESFSGLEMMCLMHAGFRRLAPDMDEPYLVALEMFELEKGGGA